MPKQQPGKQKSAQPGAVQEDDAGRRGEATKAGGNKVHGDDLEGAIPTTPMTVDSPDRDGAETDIEALK